MKLSQVDLNLLVALDALLRERNVTLAGKQIGLSQPAMSAALARLRGIFNDRLFERVAGSYRLTPVAESLAEPLQVALQAVQRTLDYNATFDPNTSKQHFRIAVSDHLLLVLCPQLIQRLQQLAPAVQLHTQPVTHEAGAQLAARKLDLSIQPANLLRDTESQVLFEDRWVCAVWRGNPHVKGHITAEQLYTMPHASFQVSRTPLAEQLLTPPLARAPNVHVTTSSFVSLPFMLRGTPLIALIQRSLGERVQSLAEIRLLELPVPVAALVFEMSWNPMFTADPAHAWLRSMIAELSEPIGASLRPTPMAVAVEENNMPSAE